ncbi:MAG: hypothetical protein RMM51_10950 [Verrucomicrobiae bacterium]|nr:hypothetical protein [Verrucomicrobiae bacterium]
MSEPSPQPSPAQPPGDELVTPTPASAAEPDGAIQQMQFQLACLAIGTLLLSLTFSAFVLKQNRNIGFAIRVREQQIQQTSEALKKWTPVLNELAGYSLNNPELSAIFTRYGLQINTPPPTGSR